MFSRGGGWINRILALRGHSDRARPRPCPLVQSRWRGAIGARSAVEGLKPYWICPVCH